MNMKGSLLTDLVEVCIIAPQGFEASLSYYCIIGRQSITSCKNPLACKKITRVKTAILNTVYNTTKDT